MSRLKKGPHSPYGRARAFARAPRASPGTAGQVNIPKLRLCLREIHATLSMSASTAEEAKHEATPV